MSARHARAGIIEFRSPNTNPDQRDLFMSQTSVAPVSETDNVLANQHLAPPRLEGQATLVGNFCRQRVGDMVKRALQLNMAETGQNHTQDPLIAENQAELFARGTIELTTNLTKARSTAEAQYKQYGQLMCQDCYGPEGCPLRAKDDDKNFVIKDATNLRIYARLMPASARNNIKIGKPTPVTIKHSREALDKTPTPNNSSRR